MNTQHKSRFVFVTVLLLFIFGLAFWPQIALATTYNSITMDGANDFSGDELVASSTHGGGGVGADLDSLYITWDATNLYLGLTTLNADSWDVAYGFALDIDQTSSSGYAGSPTPADAWGRFIGFGDLTYLPEYEIYAWWGGASGLGAPQLWGWNGVAWVYSYDLGASDYGWNGNFPGPGAGTGLQYLEIAIPWTNIGGVPQNLNVYAWVAGGGGSSAVDTAPPNNTAVPAGDSWVDDDFLSRSFQVVVDSQPDGIPDIGYAPNTGQPLAVSLSNFTAAATRATSPIAIFGIAAILLAGILVIYRRR